MAIAPIPSPQEDKAKVEVYQENNLKKLKDKVDALSARVKAAKKVVTDTQSKITSWTKWVSDIQLQLRIGYNLDYDMDGTKDSYIFSYDPTVIPLVSKFPLTTNQAEGYVTRGKQKIASLNSVLRDAKLSVEDLKAKLLDAIQKYEAAAKKSGVGTGVNTNTIGGIESSSGIDYNNDGKIGGSASGGSSGGGGGGGGTGSGNDTDNSDKNPVLKNVDAKSVKVNFNIPMVKSAYFPNDSLQDKYVSKKVGNWTLKPNGRKMWLGDSGGKGVIQPNLAVAATQLSKTYKNSKAIVKGLNNKVFGFRFLYNPSSISMQWGISQEVDPNTIGLGLDKGIPLTGNLSPSSVSFELILNRIEDMQFLKDSAGNLKDGVNYNPWPTTAVPDAEELAEIYERGTMYDLDFLFAALIPGAPKYRSNLNGILADRGYMSGYTCELHLGPRMRYNVQIASLSVEHILFNERMVPMLSQVQITATRLPDVKQGIVKGYGINTKDYAGDGGN